MPIRLALCFCLGLCLSACVSSTPTADKLDQIEQDVRNEYRQDYATLEDQRRSGAISTELYQVERAKLDKRVQNRVDTMAWNRHALVQSDMKANAIPTPDRPQQLAPPGVGSISGSVYNSQRQNGMGNQVMGNMMQELGNSRLNSPGAAGTMYDYQ